MRTKKERGLKESNSLNIEKDEQQFPASQFNKDQRKDVEKALHENEQANAKDEPKESD